ncbi:MAG: DUF3052 family protein [Chitinophagales bacterium]|nr:DUF3052 family protein [Chitinophagaceae bacterium]MCB9064217.1 DUF3052 family protein [Chitinophagales bacterium]
MATTSGYSGTLLAKKLGIKAGHVIRLINEPAHYFELFDDFPLEVTVTDTVKRPKNLIHMFTKEEKELKMLLPKLKKEILSDGCIWVSWPKKASKVPTDVTEDVVRDLALSIGLVDVKVCAVDAIWSGLKLVIPVKDRQK